MEVLIEEYFRCNVEDRFLQALIRPLRRSPCRPPFTAVLPAFVTAARAAYVVVDPLSHPKNLLSDVQRFKF